MIPGRLTSITLSDAKVPARRQPVWPGDRWSIRYCAVAQGEAAVPAPPSLPDPDATRSHVAAALADGLNAEVVALGPAVPLGVAALAVPR